MKNNKGYKFLGIAILSFGVVLLSLFFIMLFVKEPSENLDDLSFTSEYIADQSKDLGTEIVPEQIPEGTEINPVKQGELKKDESRKVVSFKSDLSEADKSRIEEEYDIEFTQESSINGVYTVITTEESDINNLEEDSTVESVETDIPVKMAADVIDWGVSRIGADKIWDTATGVGVTVAVIDTGIEMTHPDLQGKVTKGYDFVNDKDSPEDDNGHGTHVSGIVIAARNNTGTVGVSHGTSVMPVKVLNSAGSGYISDVAKGIYWAADNGAQIINLSLGAPVDTDVLRKAVNYAASKGVLMVAAAGNEYGAPCQYPAAYGNVICVVATDSSNRLASFSNVGGELAAPGVSNYSTFLGGTYRYLSGTSMASPHVAGSLALLRGICTDCTSSELIGTLRDTAIDLGAEGTDIIFGYGLVDLRAAAEEYLNTTEEELIEEAEEITGETPEEEATPTAGRGNVERKEPTSVKQKPVIVEPKKDKNDRFTMTKVEDIEIEFRLEPVIENAEYEKTVIYVNNKEVYTTTETEDTYTLAYEDFEGVQQFVKVTSHFTNCTQPQVHDDLIIDRAKLMKLNPSKSILERGRQVLGISSAVPFKGIFNFWW
ncbi:MAG: S8 family peptidase [Candidatus Dojkabacteria bacterium]